jgi:P-type Cu+ transporter
METADKTPPEQRTDPTGDLLRATDPVCVMSVDPSHAAGSALYDGTLYYFCSKSCQQKFLAAPAKFTADTLKSTASLPSTGGTIYTCPMHPEVRQDLPGTCPKCGMTLELAGNVPAVRKRHRGRLRPRACG